MPKELILLVDDEEDIGEILDLYLTAEGYQFIHTMTGAETLQIVKQTTPHLIVLDVFLPDIDGHELCKQLRQMTNAPILFLSCKDSELDRIIGLSVGGDDYIGKPFRPNELVARIKANLRRSTIYQNHADVQLPTNRISSNSLQVHLLSHDVFVHGSLIELSTKEYHLLVYFMNHPKQVLAAEHLLRTIWGYNIGLDTKTLQVHIGSLRRKIEENPSNPKLIVTLRGVGYKFSEEADAV